MPYQQKHSQLFQEKNLYISKNILKLLVKHSKCLLEGKEFYNKFFWTHRFK